MRHFVLLSLLWAGTPGTATSLQNVPERFRPVADSLRSLVETKVVPSVAVSLVGPEGIIWEAGFGFADIERQTVATAHTAYPVASVAKSLTAVGAMRAVQLGLLDLDRPIEDYMGAGWVRVPAGDSRRLTSRALLRMIGGIPHLVHFHWQGKVDHDAGLDSAARFAAFEPGTQFFYSNLSLGLMGDIIARVSGGTFADFMAANVFGPLGMLHSAVRRSGVPGEALAQTYTRTPFTALDLEGLEPSGGAGMLTSAHDLALLLRTVFFDSASGFLDSGSRQAFIDPGGFPYYSHGWWRFAADSGRTALVADGAAYGYAASAKVLPGQRIAVAVLVNGGVDDGFTLALCDYILAAYGARLSTFIIPAEFVDRPAPTDSTWAGRWAGTVLTPMGSIPIRLAMDSTTLSVALGTGNLQPVPNSAVSNHVLSADIAGALPDSVLNHRPHRLSITLRRYGERLTGYVSATVSENEKPLLVVPFYAELRRDE